MHCIFWVITVNAVENAIVIYKKHLVKAFLLNTDECHYFFFHVSFDLYLTCDCDCRYNPIYPIVPCLRQLFVV